MRYAKIMAIGGFVVAMILYFAGGSFSGTAAYVLVNILELAAVICMIVGVVMLIVKKTAKTASHVYYETAPKALLL